MDGSRYTIEVFGGCLGEWVPDGTVFVADPSEPPRPLDLCSIFIRPGDGPWARFMRSCGEEFGAACKLFLGWQEGPDGRLAMVGQLVPPVVSLIPETEIASIHRIVGRCDGGAERMTENDRAAWRLVAPFACPAIEMQEACEWNLLPHAVEAGANWLGCTTSSAFDPGSSSSEPKLSLQERGS